MQFPEGDNRARAFPFNGEHNQFLGPAIVDGKPYRMMVWYNIAQNGNPYLRVVFEPYVAQEAT